MLEYLEASKRLAYLLEASSSHGFFLDVRHHPQSLFEWSAVMCHAAQSIEWVDGEAVTMMRVSWLQGKGQSERAAFCGLLKLVTRD